MDVSLTSLDTNTYIGKLFKGAFQAVITPYASSASPTPTTSASVYAGAPPPQGSNYANLQDSLLDSAYQAAISSPVSERCQHWVDFQEELLRSDHLLPLVSRQYSWFGKSVGFVAWGGYLDGSSIRAK